MSWIIVKEKHLSEAKKNSVGTNIKITSKGKIKKHLVSGSNTSTNGSTRNCCFCTRRSVYVFYFWVQANWIFACKQYLTKREDEFLQWILSQQSLEASKQTELKGKRFSIPPSLGELGNTNFQRNRRHWIRELQYMIKQLQDKNSQVKQHRQRQNQEDQIHN